MPADCLMYPASPLPPAELVGRLERLASALVSDGSGRWAGATGLGPIAGLKPGQVVVGPAFTVRTRPGDNLVVHKAMDIARPGEVLVVAAGGHTDRALLGGLMGQYAATKGIVALVVDGAVRDRSDLDRVSPPVFATGLTHLGPYKNGPGELRGPVSVGGVVIRDGDLLVCDEDGVAVIPRHRAEEITSAAEAKFDSEAAERRAIAEGTWDRSWIDAALAVREVS
ncbi:RraA family protein [Blastococcus haudaquaticus]|uniref:Putative 4-hydroxy-4-methyl-2-oxoglutarate aldolase n=1 Tax=Blastococcus haudaquaticus TaxID=1938745 RepID=A0A286GTY6_9ACTN|nr:RraA family protein [Blastococcus haudaquaticus]SOD98988.1 Regulator of RNase E activity RraA [Blastococcus haudaquaticus]